MRPHCLGAHLALTQPSLVTHLRSLEQLDPKLFAPGKAVTAQKSEKELAKQEQVCVRVWVWVWVRV
jgi:hypothetical protein